MTINAWLEQLAARGIATRIVNGRLRHFPASAYKQLTDAEVIFLRHNREAIKNTLSGITPADSVTTPTINEVEAAAVRVEPIQSMNWDSVGLYRKHSVVTHALGDEHAQRILSGDIPLAEAQRQEQRRRRDSQAIAAGAMTWE